MSERIHEIKVDITVDTNKATYRESLVFGLDHDIEAFAERVRRAIAAIAEDEHTHWQGQP